MGTEFCQVNPQYSGSNHDFAFCKLAQPVTNVEIVPILMGCETSILAPGTEIVLAGFGQTENGGVGQKREVNCYVVTSSTEGAVVQNIKRKERDSETMLRMMVANMADISSGEIRSTKRIDTSYKPTTKIQLPSWI